MTQHDEGGCLQLSDESAGVHTQRLLPGWLHHNVIRRRIRIQRSFLIQGINRIDRLVDGLNP